MKGSSRRGFQKKPQGKAIKRGCSDLTIQKKKERSLIYSVPWCVFFVFREKRCGKHLTKACSNRERVLAYTEFARQYWHHLKGASLPEKF